MHNSEYVTIAGGWIFDGDRLHNDKAARFEAGVFIELIDESDVSDGENIVELDDDILSTGLVDLQVNGGGGILFNDDPSLDTLDRIADAHYQLGTHFLLPTLITDSVDKTNAAITAACDAVEQNIPGIAGLHLEGPHISLAKQGAHDAEYIRTMNNEDLQQLLAAKSHLPVLKVTIAPENVTLKQVETMAKAGILVSLGHTDADFDTCLNYTNAGARCVTHLFNAMSQLGSRDPGLVGAALHSNVLHAGVIADGIHVHTANLEMIFRTKNNADSLFLVSDAMAVAGSDEQEFLLNDRRVVRENGRLSLEDGTLAGADLDLVTAIKMLTNDAGVPMETALRAATAVPAALINIPIQFTAGETELDSLIRIS